KVSRGESKEPAQPSMASGQNGPSQAGAVCRGGKAPCAKRRALVLALETVGAFSRKRWLKPLRQQRNVMASLKIRPEIDGLRAVAVLPVMLYHAGLGCPGGFVGVDAFFVISGYLITTLILKDLDAGCFQLLGFWERRVRRILPALAVVVLAALAAGWFLFLAVDYRE